MRSLSIIREHSQIRELGSKIKFDILKELIKNPATCQQMSIVFGLSKQKVHYHLTKLMEEGLIEIDQDQLNNKEVYYRATAANYVLDFSLGSSVSDSMINSREIINSILNNDHKIDLSHIARKILDECLVMKPRENLLVTTGKYNLPLVEKLVTEASRKMIRTTLLFQDYHYLETKYNEFSLAAFNADYENFNKLLANHDVYLNLNGESRYVALNDPTRIEMRNKHFEKSRSIIHTKGIRIAVMPGLLQSSITEHSIESELQFWQALDVDYQQQSTYTLGLCRELDKKSLHLEDEQIRLDFEVSKVLGESGSFNDDPYQSPVINLPGGEVLLIPAKNSLNGTVTADAAYIFGEMIPEPYFEIKENRIVHFGAREKEAIINKALEQGGPDGREVALLCLGSNSHIKLEAIDQSFKHKSKDLMTIYWGENRSLGGDVSGQVEWFIQMRKPKISIQEV